MMQRSDEKSGAITTLAIDIGGAKLAAALIGVDGQIRGRQEFPTSTSQTPQALRDALSVLVSPLQTRVQRVIITSTGVARDGNLLALNPHNPSGLLRFPLVKMLEQLTNLPTIVTSDAQATAWTEYQALDGDITDMVFITVSTSVGGDVVSGGKLCTDLGGLAGHIGHTLADPHSPVCGYGRTDRVEAIASGHGIAMVAQRELAGANMKTISTHAGRGDEQTQQLIHRFTHVLTRLIIDIKTTTDCRYMMIGGSVGLAEGYLVLMEMCLAQEPATFHAGLLVAHYRRDIGLFGAALLAQGEIL